MRWRLLAVVVAVVAACADDGPVSLPSSASSSSTKPSSLGTTTTEVDFETEVRRAAVELIEIRNDVFQHPDVARLDEYLLRTCTCWEAEQAAVLKLSQRGARFDRRAALPVGVRLEVRDPTEPVLLVVVEQPTVSVIERDGTASHVTEPLTAAGLSLSLLRSAGTGPWLLNGLAPALDLNDATIASVIAEGLP